MINFSVLDDQLIDRIIDEAYQVLEETGVEVQCDELIQRMESAGLPYNKETKRITFPRSVVEKSIASSPEKIKLFDRDGDPFSTIGGDQTNFVPASSALNILDWRTGERRTAQTSDFIEYIKVVNQTKHIDYPSTAFSTDDIPQDIADAWRLYISMAHSRKPIVTGAFTHHGVPRMARMMECFRKDENEMIEKPMAVFTCCPNSPLRWGIDSSHNLIDCVEKESLLKSYLC